MAPGDKNISTLSAENLVTLQKIAEGTAGSIGNEFFLELVSKVSETIDVFGAWVTELAGEKKVRTLALWINRRFVDNFEYDVTGSPCEPVLTANDIFVVPENVVELFPEDDSLAELGAVSYMGVALKSIEGKLLGHLAVLDNKPMRSRPGVLAIFRIFASRAGAELQRLQAEKEINESKERLNRLVNGTHDAIIELNEKLEITQANEAAFALFDLSKNTVPGYPLKNLLSLDGLKKMTYSLLHVKEKMSDKIPYHWIPGYLECRTTGEKEFPAEGTLTKYEANGSIYFILILRNVLYKIEAEEKIKTLSIEREILREEIRNIYNLDEIIGNSFSILEAMRSVQRVSSTNTTVLLTGETGTGKELFARAIHNASPRKDKPLIKINCAALPASLIESELFGHEKGAFTGAANRRLGKFALADEGTIFLDEVSELPLELQAKLLRVLQEGEFDTIGGNKTIKVNVRVIAATNQDLHNLVKAGKFRNDLYYRLNIFPIQIPSLRDRSDDIILLAEAFLKKFSIQMNKKVSGLSILDKQKLIAYRWPGNVRELQNIIERAVITSDDGVIDLSLEKNDSDSLYNDKINNRILTSAEILALEKENIIRAINTCNGKISGPNGAATLLEMPTSTLTSKMKALGISH